MSRRRDRPGRREREDKKKNNKKASVLGNLQPIEPQTPGQAELLDAIAANRIVICDGPAGTGKTFISFGSALHARLDDHRINKIVIVRPVIPAGEDDLLGYLPGDLNEKMRPFIAPLMKDAAPQLIEGDSYMDALDYQRFLAEVIARLDLEIVPLAFMRGRTFNNAFVILDEAQNCTKNDFKLFMTRIGKDSRIIIEGDSTQCDRDDGYLAQLQVDFKGMRDTAVVKLDDRDIVRDELIAEIIRRLG